MLPQSLDMDVARQGRNGMRLVASLLWSALIVGPTAARGATIVVPTDQPTIQAAVAAARENDTVLVQPGTYTETVHVALGQRGLTIAGTEDRNPPILQAGGDATDVGLDIDGIDDVSVRNFVFRGWSEAVRIERAYGAVLKDLRIENIFHSALQRPAGLQRDAFLDGACCRIPNESVSHGH